METYPCPGPVPPQTAHEGPHPDCPECGPDYADYCCGTLARNGTCSCPDREQNVGW